jgi:hypothetical protein
MHLSETGESRVRGYLYVLERSLRTFLPRDEASDAVREVETHIRDRVAEVEPMPNERAALESVLDELGAPLTVARAYSLEVSAEEAVITGRIVPIARSLLRIAALSVGGFFAAIGALIGYMLGISFLAIAILKPFFPENVGIWMRNGLPQNMGAQFPPPGDQQLVGGFWPVIVISVVLGVAVLVLTHSLVRRMLGGWLSRRRERAALGVSRHR